MSKYNPLNKFLLSIDNELGEIRIKFLKIEQILGFKLPKSSFKHRAWWANPTSSKQHPHAQSWLLAGWVVKDVSFENQYVTFSRSIKDAHESNIQAQTSENRLNPAKGKTFQKISAELLSSFFDTDFLLEYSVEIGNPPKVHKFDLASRDKNYIGECKSYSWTKTGNIPSAKIAFLNEALFYLSFLPETVYKFIVMRRALHETKSESLSEYYLRQYNHLFGGVHLIEIDVNNNTVKEVET